MTSGYLIVFLIYLLQLSNNVSTQKATTISTSTVSATTSKSIGKTLLDAVKEFADWKTDIKNAHPDCFDGQERSPVNIDVVKAVPIQFSPLKFINYNSTGLVRQRKFENFTEAVFGFRLWQNRPMIIGGGLPYKYYLEEIHWAVSEWSSHSPIQSGHTINGAYHFMEAHFVHVREGFRLEDARNKPGHVAIVAVFFELTVNTTSRAKKNKEMSTLDQPLFSKNGLDEPYDFVQPAVLLPKDHTSFYRYNGSFVHPPCSTGVLWTLLIQPVVISYSQLYKFIMYTTRSRAPIPISYLVDEVPSLNGRTVFLNYGMSGMGRVLIIRPGPVNVNLIALIVISVVCVVLLYLRCNRSRGIMSFDNIAMEDIPDK